MVFLGLLLHYHLHEFHSEPLLSLSVYGSQCSHAVDLSLALSLLVPKCGCTGPVCGLGGQWLPGFSLAIPPAANSTAAGAGYMCMYACVNTHILWTVCCSLALEQFRNNKSVFQTARA